MLFEKITNFFSLQKVLGLISSRWTIKNSIPRTPSNATIKKPSPKIQYLMQDPNLPNLTKQIDPPIYKNPPAFLVKGYVGAGHAKETPQGQAANCFVTISNTLNYFKSKSTISIPNWPGTSSLQIIPRAGIDLNAYYDRKSLRFFYYTDARIGGTIFTCDSADIVAHELGHAIFDTFRPKTWSAVSIEIASFHESFGDFTALIHALLYDEVLALVISETGGDLRKNNIVSNLAEQFGMAVYKISGINSGRLSNALRSAINDFKYVNPSSLPYDAPDNQLAQEPHSFGKVFLGILWDVLVMIYEDIKSTGINPVEALRQARDIITTYMLKTIQNAPLNANFYQSVAKTMLWADAVIGNKKYQEKMQEIFRKRNLSTTQLRILAAPKCTNDDLVVKDDNLMIFKLSDKVIATQSDNVLYQLELEMPNESAFLYDQNKDLFDSIGSTEDQSVTAAVEMVSYLQATNNVSNDPSTYFEIRDGRLERTHF